MSAQTWPVPIAPRTLGTLFEFTYGVFRQNTAGITPEETLRAPEAGGNCMNWVGAHLVASRQGLLELLGRKATWTEEERKRYARGAEPLADVAEAIPWERIVADLDASQEELRAGIAALTPEQLAAPLPEDRNPFRVDSLGTLLAVFNFHESYHVGQLGLLRRLLGKPGAIA